MYKLINFHFLAINVSVKKDRGHDSNASERDKRETDACRHITFDLCNLTLCKLILEQDYCTN